MTRDSWVLKVLLLLSVILGVLASVTDPALYGFDPVTGAVILNYIKLAAVLVGAITGYLQTSPLKGENDDKRMGGPRAWLLPLLLAGSMAATSCAGFMPAPATPAGPTAPVMSEQQVNEKAMQFATVGTAVLGIAQQALELSHVVIPPSQLGIDIDDAAAVFGQTLKDIAIRAKAIVSEPTLRTVYGQVIDAADKFLAVLERAKHPQLSGLAGDIRSKLQVIRLFLGGAQ